MAVVSGVTVVPNARIAGVALTGLHGDKAVAAMGKTLEREGGKRVLRKQERGRAHKSDEPLFHTFPPCLDAAIANYLGQRFTLRNGALVIRQRWREVAQRSGWATVAARSGAIRIGPLS
jgi:hypothetical protein